MTSLALVDAHVHVYPEFSPDRLLSSAWRNLQGVAQRLGAGQWQGYLLLTETARDHWFDAALTGQARLAGQEGWTLRPTPGCDCSLTATAGAGSLVIIAGGQIVTSEGIELHALGTRARFADRQPAEAVLQAIAQAQALAAIPWGVGKWVGGRGRLVRDLLSTSSTPPVLAADNGGRPGFWREPLLELGSHAILRGSDPLPLRGEESRAGESGVWFAFDGEPSAPRLMDQLRRLPREQVHSFGPSERPVRFLRNQIALRLQRR